MYVGTRSSGCCFGVKLVYEYHANLFTEHPYVIEANHQLQIGNQC